MDNGTCTTLAWARASNGTLTDDERRMLRRQALRGYRDFLRGMLSAPLRRPSSDLTAPTPPDSKLARTAQEAALDQPQSFLNHGHRTWLFGSMLADVDGATVDREYLYVASLLHDSGLAEQVAGEDFTIRSAARVLDVCERAGLDDPDAPTTMADGVVAHITPGLTPQDTVIGYYVQAGALADLAGMRAWDIPGEIRRAAFLEHPASQVFSEVPAAVAAEARAVPAGRFALLNGLGFGLVVRVSPMRRFA